MLAQLYKCNSIMENNKLITLVDVAFLASDAKEKYGMKIGDHKLICSVLDAHMDVIDQRNMERDEKLLKDIIREVAERMEAQWSRITERLDAFETKINLRINGMEKRIELLEKIVIKNGKY